MDEPKFRGTKKAVLIRVPENMYEDLLNLSATATLLQRKSVSVPALIVEMLSDVLQRQSGTIKKIR